MSETVKLLKDLRVTDLKVELEKRGLATSGVKAVLAERLQKHLEDEGVDVETHNFNQPGDDDTAKPQDDSTAEEEELERPEAVKAEVDSSALIGEQEAEAKETESAAVEENTVEEAAAENMKEDKIEPVEDDSINIMLGEDEDNLFDEDKKESATSMAATLPRTASPPKPETAPVIQPFTSRDTISLASRSHKAPSENSSMRVAVDESESVGTQESLDGMNSVKDEKQQNGDATAKEKETATKDDKENDSKNLWVSGLSSSVRAADLKAAFAKHGKVTGAKVVTSARTPGARCYGYVTMSTREEAVKCVAELNKTKLGDKIITVERAKPDSQAPPKASSSSSGSKSSSSETKKEDSSKPSTSKEAAAAASKQQEEKKKPESSEKPPKRSSSRDQSDRGRSRDHSDRGHGRQSKEGSSRSNRDRRTSPAPPRARSPGKRPVHERLSIRSPERPDRPPRPDVLTFAQIREARERDRAREEERRRRQRDRERREEEERRARETERRRRAEEESLKAMRDELRREREKIEREKAELIRLERERQRVERERLQREKEELERLRRQQASRIEEARRGVKRPPPLDEGHHRDPYYDDRNKRTAGSTSTEDDMSTTEAMKAAARPRVLTMRPGVPAAAVGISRRPRGATITEATGMPPHRQEDLIGIIEEDHRGQVDIRHGQGHRVLHLRVETIPPKDRTSH